MIVEPQTVSKVLEIAMDSVNLINSINSDASAEPYVDGMSQEEINAVVDKNVKHLEAVLEYAPRYEGDDTPDIAGSSEDKTPYTTAITTGKAYIAAN